MAESKKPEIGDLIEFTWEGQRFQGTLLSEDSVYSNIKLINGYNISIKLEDYKILERSTTRIQEVKRDMKVLGKGKPISLITTGGTIVSRVDYKTGAVFPSLDMGELTSRFPYMEEKFSINRVDFSNILSENMEPDQWIQMAKLVDRELKRSEGVLISHGTDTMSYTASALSFMFEKQRGPIILVGSQRSSDRPSSDSYLNIEAAVGFSATDFGEVGIAMHHNSSDEKIDLIRGARSRKMHSTRRDAFKAIGEGPVGRFQDGLVNFIRPYIRRVEENTISTKLEKRVGMIYFYPGLSVEEMEKNLDGKRGVILIGTGLGHIAIKHLEAIKERVKEGMKAVITTQCIFGTTNLDVYSTGRQMKGAGIMDCGNILPETAYVKMMYVLGNYDENRFPEMMRKNMRGEILEREEMGVFP
ncbi:MAG: Glu-tRNA(Gln) amidotransferase subunit GatD [Cuniculiplasma sp.]